MRALDDMRDLVQRLGDDCGLIDRSSIFLARNTGDVELLQREQKARRALGIDVDFLDAAELRAMFNLQRPAALLSRQAMEVDPHRLTWALIDAALRMGLEVFADTQVCSYHPHQQHVLLGTARAAQLRARHVVFATGYETPEFLDPDICTLKSTYALVSDVIDDFSAWPDRCLIWESGCPYFYARTTRDRVMIGGEDENITDPRERDALIGMKTRALMRKVAALLPEMPIAPACAWAGTFAQTNDGLPYIGTTAQFPRGYFALGYGGNGITFSLVAAQIIRDMLLGRHNPDAELFRFER